MKVAIAGAIIGALTLTDAVNMPGGRQVIYPAYDFGIPELSIAQPFVIPITSCPASLNVVYNLAESSYGKYLHQPVKDWLSIDEICISSKEWNRPLHHNMCLKQYDHLRRNMTNNFVQILTSFHEEKKCSASHEQKDMYTFLGNGELSVLEDVIMHEVVM